MNHSNNLKEKIKIAQSDFLNIDEVEWRKKPNPKKWSKIEVLGHLIDSALVNLQRFVEIKGGEDVYKVKRYPQDDLVRLNNYQESNVGGLIELWVRLNIRISELINSYSDEHHSIQIVLPDGQEESLDFLIEDYIDHMDHHIRQIN